MAQTTGENKNIFENVMDAQKQVFENFKNAAEQFSKNIPGGQVVEANADVFNKWYEEQMAFLNKSVKNAEGVTPAAYSEMFNNWMNMQMGLFRDFVENAKNQNQNQFQKFNQSVQDNPVTKTMQDAMKQFSDMSGAWMKFLSNNDSKSAFEGMMENANYFNRFASLWAPMMNMMNQNISADKLGEMFNLKAYQEMVNKMFGLNPDMNKTLTETWSNLINQTWGPSGEWFNNSWKQMSQMMPQHGGFESVLEIYKNMSKNLSEASTPLMKMMTPGKNREQLEAVSRINDLMADFSLKNAHMNQMMYQTGLEAFKKLSEMSFEKVKSGEVNANMMTAYQEWLNLNDKVFTKLFESEAYSQIQSELASTGMKLKREMDLQMEKNLNFLPLINRSEMDELYQTVYELKKRVRTLEKELEEKEAPAKPAAKKSK